MSRLVRALPDIARLLGRLVRDPTLPRGAKLALAAAVVYLLSPLDLVPDLLPFLGVLDDLAIAAVVLDGILNWVDRRVVLRYWPGTPESLDTLARVAGVLSVWLPSKVKSRIFGRVA
ncbi:MAG: DUF1232 domain-containing protein [Candidatus Rokubacteria bacterium]|nr:DUF1232 domain-containing protein [Candidatus Rokubacteria bacterium]